MLPGSVVRSEHTQVIVDHPGLQPDILITAPGRSPVVLEAEYMPATNAEAEAKARLGVRGRSHRTPDRVCHSSPLPRRHPKRRQPHQSSLAAATISYCVVSEDEDRFPGSGWIEGRRRRPGRAYQARIGAAARGGRSRRRPGEGDRAGGFGNEPASRVEARRDALHRRTAGYGRRHSDAPHGRGHHRQRHGVS